MCRDGFRDNCKSCGREITCRDDYPVCEWGCEPEATGRARCMIYANERP